jgi:hypothetical protein
MARAQSAFLSRTDVPARKELQAALDALGFKVTLDDTYAPFKSSGYLPCTLDGEDSGFTIKFADIGESGELPDPLRAEIGGRDVEISFRWSGDQRELACAMAVGAALSKSFSALIYDPDGRTIVAADELIDKARKAAVL